MTNIGELANIFVGNGMRSPENIDRETQHNIDSSIGRLTIHYHRETSYFTLAITLENTPIGFYQFRKPMICDVSNFPPENEVKRAFSSYASDIYSKEYISRLGFELPEENMALYILLSQRKHRLGSYLVMLGLAVLNAERVKWNAASGLPLHMLLRVVDEKVLPFYEKLGFRIEPDARPLDPKFEKTWSVEYHSPPSQIKGVNI